MKAAGTLSVLFAAFALRAALLRTGRDELRLLRALAFSLTVLAQQISATLTPLPKLLRRGDWPQAAQPFFLGVLEGLDSGHSLEQSWQVAAQTIPLAEPERALLAAPAAVLRGNEEQLLRALRAAAQALGTAAQEKAAHRAARERLITTVCMSGTLMLLTLVL